MIGSTCHAAVAVHAKINVRVLYVNFPKVTESSVVFALLSAWTVRGTVDENEEPAAAASKSGAVALRSHSPNRPDADALTAVLKARLPTTMRRKVVSMLSKRKRTVTMMDVPAVPSFGVYP